MADEKIKLEITAEDTASSAIAKVAEALGETMLGSAISSAMKSYTDLSNVVKDAMHVMESIVGSVEAVTHAAMEAEAADRKLAFAFAQTGQSAKLSSLGIDQWAEAQSQATGVSDDAIKDLVRLGVTYGMTAEQAQKSAIAALGFAAQTGQDATQAMRQFAMTLDGNVPKMLKMDTAIQGLTESQLRNGAAIEALSASYAQAASNFSGTFEGAQKGIQTGWQKILEETGKIITQNPVIIQGMKALGDTLFGVAETIAHMAEWIAKNGDTIKEWAQAIGIGVAVVGTYMLAVNAATIATTLMTVAQIALNTAVAVFASPILAVIAAVAAVAVAVKYWDEVSNVLMGTLKIIAGTVLTTMTAGLRLFLEGAIAVARAMGSDMLPELEAANDKLKEYTTGLVESGAEQVANTFTAKENAEAVQAAGTAHQEAAKKIDETKEALARSSQAFTKAKEDAKDAMSAMKEFAPDIELREWNDKKAEYLASLKHLQEASKERVKILIEAGIEGKALEDAKNAAKDASDAIKGITLKNDEEIRNNAMKNAELAINHRRNLEISVTDEIMLKRIKAEEDIYNKTVEIETQKEMARLGIAQHGIDAETAAKVAARQKDLANYQEYLNAEMQLAVSMETQKQLALANAKAGATSGLGGVAEAEGKEDQTILKEQQRQDQLKIIRNEEQNELLAQHEAGKISNEEYFARLEATENAYHERMAASRALQAQASLETEKAFHEQRAQALGLTEEGLQARIEAANTEHEMEMERLNQEHEAKLLSDEEFLIAKQQQEEAHQADTNMTRERFLQEDVERHKALRDSWGATLAQMRLEQERHGVLLGTIRGIQQSQEYQALNQGLSAGAELMRSKSKTQFEVGKAAAIAQASMNTFLGATGAFAALSPIPIVGPFLAITMAGLIIAAGMMRVQQIASTKFNPGGQADQGMDSVPHSLSGKSFVLSAGERVVQPEANKELTKAVAKINGGESNQTTLQANVTVNGGAGGDVRAIRDAVIDGLREASERGTPIISERGIMR